MTQLATSIKADDTLRVCEWVKNSPITTASHPTNTAVLDTNTVTVTTAAPQSVDMGAPTTTPLPSIPVVTSVTPPPAPTANDIPSVTGLGSLVYIPTTESVQNPSKFMTFPTGPSNPHVGATPGTTNHTAIPTVFPATGVAAKTSPIIPVTAGGTVYYINPTSMATVSAPNSTPIPSTFPTIPSATQFAHPTFITAPQPATSSFNVQDLAQLLASSKRDYLPEWKLEQYSGDPLQWREWYGQFKSAIDSAPLTDDVKLTYLKTLGSGKAKTTIAEFAYSGTMYKDALKTLERKFGQPQTVVSAYLDKLAN